MFDIATRRGVTVDVGGLSAALGIPVVTSIAVRKGGTADLAAADRRNRSQAPVPRAAKISGSRLTIAELARHPARGRPHHRGEHQPAMRPDTWTVRIDAVVRTRWRARHPGADPVS